MRLPGRLISGPIRPNRHSALRFASMRWAALPIVDRRWTVPMAAVALGFGLFIGVAISPGADGTLGQAAPVMVQVPAPSPPVSAQPPVGTAPSKPAGGRGSSEPNHPASPSSPSTASPALTSPAPSTTPSYTPPSYTPPSYTTPSYTPPAYTPPVTTTPPATTPSETTPSATDTVPTTTLTGTVVHLNPKAGSYSIATDSERLIAIHSQHLPTPGDVIEVPATTLANGTYGEDGDRDRQDSRNSATFSGAVTFKDSAAGGYTVSAPGVSAFVRTTKELPRLGATVEVKARFANPPRGDEAPAGTQPAQVCGDPPAQPGRPSSTLEQVESSVTDNGDGTGDVEGIVQGVCRDDRKLIVSADDVRESRSDISLTVPKDLRIAHLKPGDVVYLTTRIRQNGSQEVTGISDDQRQRRADNVERTQGDLSP